MSRPLVIILAIILAMLATEGMAWWWMHPTPTGIGMPILAYRPGSQSKVTGTAGQGTALPTSNNQQAILPTSAPQSVDASSTDASSIQNPKSKIQNSSPSSTCTFLPEVVAKSLPRLSANTGTVARIDREDGSVIHLAFFEWDLLGSQVNTVMEAFIHLPEECMGSIGMTTIEHRPPHSYQVGQETLSFDHTVLRDPAGAMVHAFKGTWVSGSTKLLGEGLRGGMKQWHQLHMKAALHRFRPAYARVAQGAVRGIPDPDLAWQTFASSMLVDLQFETAR